MKEYRIIRLKSGYAIELYRDGQFVCHVSHPHLTKQPREWVTRRLAAEWANKVLPSWGYTEMPTATLRGDVVI
jgi:hypothetical protein